MFSEAPNNPGICDRCSMKFLRKELFIEQETRLRVCADCRDTPVPAAVRLRDTSALRWSRPDQPESPLNTVPFTYPPFPFDTATDMPPDETTEMG